MAQLEALMLDTGPYIWPITPERWANGYNLYIFKLSAGQIGGLISNHLMGDARLELKFEQDTP